ncbi:MAG: hypothetical protein ACOVO1_10725 [Chitinophagaceae bacterium]
MFYKLQKFFNYWRWWLNASNSKGHGMHSPFVFDFIINVLNDDRVFYAFKQIETVYNQIKSQKKTNRLLFKMVDYYQPKNIINIETKKTILAEYLSAANPLIPIKAVDNGDDVLVKSVMKELVKVGFVICNNSDFFYDFLPFVDNNSFLIIKDIYANKETQTSWQTIKNHTSVKATIDLFHFGIVLFNQDFKAKQHFKVRF